MPQRPRDNRIETNAVSKISREQRLAGAQTVAETVGCSPHHHTESRNPERSAAPDAILKQRLSQSTRSPKCRSTSLQAAFSTQGVEPETRLHRSPCEAGQNVSVAVLCR